MTSINLTDKTCSEQKVPESHRITETQTLQCGIKPYVLIGGGNGHLLQYSCLENFMDREAWWATVHGISKSWTQLSD